MREFKVFVPNKPGELARVTEALANQAVNIRAIASEAADESMFFRIVTNDVATTEKAFRLAGLKYEANEIMSVELLDRPGELAKIARRLARAGVNVQSLYILANKNGKTEIAMVVSDPEKARTAIG